MRDSRKRRKVWDTVGCRIVWGRETVEGEEEVEILSFVGEFGEERQ